MSNGKIALNQKTRMTTIDLNGQRKSIPSFLVDLDDDAVVVHSSVIQRLAEELSSSSFDSIKRKTARLIESSVNLQEMIKLMEEEIKFHETINLVTKYNQHIQHGFESDVAASEM